MAQAEAKAQRAIKPEAIALGVFGAIAGLAVLVIAAQLIGRLFGRVADDAPILRAFGAGRATLLGDGLIGVGIAVALGSLLAAGVAVALSPLTPLGPVRPVYPTARDRHRLAGPRLRVPGSPGDTGRHRPGHRRPPGPSVAHPERARPGPAGARSGAVSGGVWPAHPRGHRAALRP